MTMRKALIYLRVMLCELGRWLPTRGIRIHGGGLEWDGIGLMVVGPSCRGKSTLMQLLVCADFRFLQDQNIELTSNDHLWGNRFPGWLRAGGFEVVKTALLKDRADVDRWVWTRTGRDHFWMLPPADLRSQKFVPLGLIVEVQFTAEAAVQLETLDRETATELLRGQLRGSRADGPERMADIAERYPCVRLTYGRADQYQEVATALRTRLAGPEARG